MKHWGAISVICLFGCQTAVSPEQAPSAAAQTEAEPVSESIWENQKLIRNARIDLEVDDVEASARSVTAIAKRYDGIVADSQKSQFSGGRPSAAISVRVPAGSLDASLAEIRQLGSVEYEGVSAQDVTKAYFDLETRLSVKRGAADRIRDLLQTRTGTLSDVIEAETELSRLTEEIEKLEGEKRFYDHRVATSTIDVSLAGAEGWIAGFLSPARKAFGESSKLLGGSLQVMIYVLLVLGPWFVVVLLGLWIHRRFSGSRNS